MTGSCKSDHVIPLDPKLSLLKLHDFYRVELAKLMHHLTSDKLPKIAESVFSKITDMRTHSTRQEEYQIFLTEILNDVAAPNKR